jgi:hypothetical protein
LTVAARGGGVGVGGSGVCVGGGGVAVAGVLMNEAQAERLKARIKVSRNRM